MDWYMGRDEIVVLNREERLQIWILFGSVSRKTEAGVRRLLRSGNELRAVANAAAEHALVTGNHGISPRGHHYRYGVVPRFAAKVTSVGSSVASKSAPPSRREGGSFPDRKRLLEDAARTDNYKAAMRLIDDLERDAVAATANSDTGTSGGKSATTFHESKLRG
ncbi:hypothetical protein Trydic_g21652 [Trypoxylus dichotomus]